MTWIEGRNRPTLTPEPRSIAWVARGVVMNRSSSAAAGDWLVGGRVVAAQPPSAVSP